MHNTKKLYTRCHLQRYQKRVGFIFSLSLVFTRFRGVLDHSGVEFGESLCHRHLTNFCKLSGGEKNLSSHMTHATKLLAKRIFPPHSSSAVFLPFALG